MPPKMKIILESVLGKITPTAVESRGMSRFSDLLRTTAERFGGRPVMCGSVEKGTWLRGRKELDLFLLFDESEPRKTLEKTGMDIAKKIFKAVNGKSEISYAEHPYLKGEVKFGGDRFMVDIVPAFDVADSSKIKSSVDRTPYHVRFVKDHLGKLSGDVMLMKQFCKGNGVYGADLKTQGFSGYLCELLVIEFGGFEKVVRAASDWDAGVVIDYHKRKSMGVRKRFGGALIVTDPVDLNRNVASAVSVESFYKFSRACARFLKSPSGDDFFYTPSKLSVNEFRKTAKKRGTLFHVIDIKRPDVLDDVLWPQIRKLSDRVMRELKEMEFDVLGKCYWADDKKVVLVFEMESWSAPTVRRNIGPSVFAHKNSKNFLKRYSRERAFVENDKWVIELKRKFLSSEDLLKWFFSGKQKDLLARGVPSKLVYGGKVISGDKVFGYASNGGEVLWEYFETNLNN